MVNYIQTRSSSGGVLRHDAHYGCATDQALENVFWEEEGTGPLGNYSVFVVYYAVCEDSGATLWRVDLEVDDNVSDFQGTLEPGSQEPYLVTAFQR